MHLLAAELRALSAEFRDLRRHVADGLGIVAVGIEDEGSVIIGMIFGPETGTAIVLATGLDRRSIEGIDRGD